MSYKKNVCHGKKYIYIVIYFKKNKWNNAFKNYFIYQKLSYIIQKGLND